MEYTLLELSSLDSATPHVQQTYVVQPLEITRVEITGDGAGVYMSKVLTVCIRLAVWILEDQI